ncbi:hypothetical protein [Nostoc sp. FACHB-280]|uniref:hypothetical protein n=1 Tax=Nostoc sp. FACHB-280 TaxID=2692839 RepID=UPI00168A86BB|nr:hypothetical protein [Nostoc sp. FACHB-280]MBD2495010.1 hypothetical protein [Nostoc sp. FACHB-280]
MAEQCKDIDAALARLNEAINKLNSRFGVLENKISGLQSSVNDLNSKIGELKNTDSDIKSRINRLANDVNDLKKLKQGQPDDKTLNNLSKRVGKLETYCSSVEQYLLGITKLVTAVRNFLR